MRERTRKLAGIVALLILTPAVAALSGGSSAAYASTYVSGSITIGSPIAVLGFSYGNPYLYGPVYSYPVHCPQGPLYYYPAYHVYAPYYSSFSYSYYPRPVVYYPRYQHPHYGYRAVVPYRYGQAQGPRYAGPGRGHGYARYAGQGRGHGYARHVGQGRGNGYARHAGR